MLVEYEGICSRARSLAGRGENVNIDLRGMSPAVIEYSELRNVLILEGLTMLWLQFYYFFNG